MTGPRKRADAKGAAREPVGTLAVRVVPRAAREELAGFRDGILRVRLAAPPLEDRANEALVRFLARLLDVPRRCVELAAGTRSRDKIVRVHGLGDGEIRDRLGLQQAPDQPPVHLDRRAR